MVQSAVRLRLGTGPDDADPHASHSGDKWRASECPTFGGDSSMGRQVTTEARGHITQGNPERMLFSTHVPVLAYDERRMVLIGIGSNVHRGLVLYCDGTIFSPASGNGSAHAGTSERGWVAS